MSVVALLARRDEHLHLIDLERSTRALPQRVEQIGPSRRRLILEVHRDRLVEGILQLSSVSPEAKQPGRSTTSAQ